KTHLSTDGHRLGNLLQTLDLSLSSSSKETHPIDGSRFGQIRLKVLWRHSKCSISIVDRLGQFLLNERLLTADIVLVGNAKDGLRRETAVSSNWNGSQN